MVPPTQLLEAWGDPLTLDPVRWEFELGAGEGATRTVWILPTATTTTIEIPFLILAGDGEGWTPIETDVVSVEVRQTDHRTELRDLRNALIQCAQSTDDPAVLEVLRDMLAATERVALASTDRSAAARTPFEICQAHSPLPRMISSRVSRIFAADWLNSSPSGRRSGWPSGSAR